MRKLIYVLSLSIFLYSCSTQPPKSSRNDILVKNASKYKGTPYKWGGITKEGMDCSGLIHRAFGDLNIPFPRASYEQAEHFSSVRKKDIRTGDLVYFKIGNTSRINHTGIISNVVSKDVILFWHSSSSAGVREDNLYSNYWKPKFVKATRPKL